LLTLFFIGSSIVEAAFECYSGSYDEKATGAGTCNGEVCELVVQYKGMALNAIEKMTGSCISDQTTKLGCWKYQGEHKARISKIFFKIEMI
ncbi:hypothetical protein PMAYCL1PPCAC_07842, partial [Pristionchus mayeri]